MYATVRVYKGTPELADALVAREDDVRQLIVDISGFEAYYLVKTADGAASISVFEDEAGTNESTRRAAAFIAENLPDLSVAAPEVLAGEVVISG